MPWLTLDHQQQETKEKLDEKFQVDGIPTFILIDGDSGDIICKDARNQIQSKDKEGQHFPWKQEKEEAGEGEEEDDDD